MIKILLTILYTLQVLNSYAMQHSRTSNADELTHLATKIPHMPKLKSGQGLTNSKINGTLFKKLHIVIY